MSLPNYYRDQNASKIEYFEDCVTFLEEYQWIYNFPNTDILIRDIFSKIPSDWKRYLEKASLNELNSIPFGLFKEEWPESLKCFIKKIVQLKPTYSIADLSDISLSLPNNFSRGLNPKKQHEIINLSKYIHGKCQSRQITTIIDLGAGLGYISHLLNESYGYKILAIESDNTTYNSAIKRQHLYYPKSKINVQYFQHFVNDNSTSIIHNELLRRFNNGNENFTENVCLIGLHACADLTITSLSLFLKLDYVKLIIIMPCCYNKLRMTNEAATICKTKTTRLKYKNSLSYSLESDNFEMFENFPMCKSLKIVYEKYNGWIFLKKPFLRVSCQSSASVWKKMTQDEYDQHSISHLRRSIIQYYAMKNNYLLVKLKRKCMTRLTSSDCDFLTYLQRLNNGFYLVKHNEPHDINKDIIEKDYGNSNYSEECRISFTSADVQNNLLDIWLANESKLKLVQILSCLQNSIQSVCENLILFDRVQYMLETNNSCFVEKIISEEISPRCNAIVAYK